MPGKEGAGKIPAALLCGLITGLVVTAVGAMVAATLVNANTIDQTMIGYAAMVIILLGGAAAAFAAVLKLPQMRFVMCLSGALVYLLGLICCAAILFDGVKTGLFPAILVTVAGGMAVYLLGLKRSRRTKYRLPKVRL